MKNMTARCRSLWRLNALIPHFSHLLPKPIMRHILAAALAVSTLAAPPRSASAQTIQQMLADWQRQRETFLAYIDAMPDSAMSYHPTPGVRDFAQQVMHAVGTNLEVAAMALRGAKD